MRFLMLTIFAFTFSSGLYAGNTTCKERYESAKLACGNQLHDLCTDVSSCKSLRTKCPQNIGDVASCEEFKQCTLQHTSTIYNTACTYEWQGHPSGGGSCKNSNGAMEKVTISCPGYSISLAPFADREFNCMGQITRFRNSKENCEKAISYYQRTCAADIDRPNLRVTKCEQANAPLTAVSDTVTAEDKAALNISRGKSYSTMKWSLEETLKKPAAGPSYVVGQ